MPGMYRNINKILIFEEEFSMKYLYCWLVVLLGILLSGNPTISKINPNILSILGWTVALFIYSQKGGNL